MTEDNPISNPSNLKVKSLFGSTSIYPWRRWDVIAATITINLFALVVPVMVFQLYDRIIPNQTYDTLILLGIGAALVVILESMIRFSRSHIVTYLGLHYEQATTVAAFDHLVHSRLNHLAKAGIGEHIENLESSGTLKEFMAGSGFLTLIDLPFVLLFIAVLGYFSEPLAVASSLIIVGFVTVILVLGRKLTHLLELQMDVNDRRYNFIIELFTNHHTLKSMGMESLLLRRYERIQKLCSTLQYNVYYTSEESRDMGNTFSYIMFISIVGIAGWEVIYGITTLGVMGASIVLTNRILQPIQACMGMWTRFQYFRIAKHRMKEHYRMGLEEREAPDVPQITQGKISVRNIQFRYEKSDVPVLSNIDFTLLPGQMVTIQGKNGAGKTTLLLILMGNLSPDSGEILIDDIPLQNINIHELRRNMVYLPPKGILFQGTIMDNLTVFRGGSVVDQALELSKKLGLDEWVRRLPLGYKTKVGDNLFLLLPDGIHQRICLVRALVSQPKILLLDEANTSLDDRGDQLLRELLASVHGEMTIIFVTHRPSMQQMADQSYDLKEGILYSKTPESPPTTERRTYLKEETHG